MKKYGLIGTIGRFKPLHKGGALMLEALCSMSEYVIIGIGSANKEKYNSRNPFTADETAEMIDSFLSKRFNNYTIIPVPDFGHIPEYKDGKKWVEYILEHYGKLDYFVTANEYVIELLKPYYEIIHPASLIPKEKHIRLNSTQVRYEIAKNGNWKSLVPEEIADYIKKNNLDERLRREFGREILSALSEEEVYSHDANVNDEKIYVREV